LYSTVLLSLFTTVQLTLLARRKYIASVRQLAREELARDSMPSVSSLLFSTLLGSASIDGLLQGALEDELESEEEVMGDSGALEPDTERKFLTLSWWLLHVGWKDIRERVRRAVEEVFESCVYCLFHTHTFMHSFDRLTWLSLSLE
jgi:peroxin-3